MIELTLPMPPTGNHMFTVYKGRKIMGKAYRDWRKIAEVLIRDQMQSQAPMAEPYKLSLKFDRASKALRDLSNYIKGPEDAIVHCGVVRDDSDCEAIYVEWTDRVPGKGAQCHIRVVSAAEGA